MRISTSLMQQLAANSILDQQSKLSKSQLQLASGNKLLAPSDDPTASAQVLDVNQSIGQVGQYQTNTTVARSRLELEDSSLNDVNTALVRIRELAVQGANASQTPETRKGIASEVRQILDSMVNTANTRDANGEYIFSGYKSHNPAIAANPDGTFSYLGDQGQRNLQISNSRQLPIGDPGSDVFMAIRENNGTFAVFDNAANTGTGIIDPGTVTDPSQYVADTYTITMSGDATSAATGGSAGSIFDDTAAPASDNSLQYQLKINGALVYTQDEGAAPLATLDDLANAINTSGTNPGVTAHVDNGKLYLSNNTPSSTPVSIQESLVDTSLPSAQPLDPGDNATGYFGTALRGDGASTSVDGTPIQLSSEAKHYFITDSAGSVVSSGDYSSGASIAWNGIQTNIKGTPDSGDSFTVRPADYQDVFSLVEGLARTLEGNTGNGALTGAQFSNAMNRVLAGLNQVETNINGIRAKVGGRLNSLDTQDNTNQEFMVQLKSTLSNLQDLDYVDATAKMNLQLVGLQAAQASFTKIQNLSLFNYIK